MKAFDMTMSTCGQAATFKALYKMGGTKVRVIIKSDSYQNQCYARVARWNGEEWKQVDYIPASEMKTQDSLAYGQAPLREHMFSQDTKALLKVAKEVLTD